jgi:predicted nuclease of predicted toxin-antitoxin system
VKFLVDNQLPPALARLIRLDLGAEATHVAEIGLRDATDTELWAYASETGSILISKDDDFVRLFLSAPTAPFIWVKASSSLCFSP